MEISVLKQAIKLAVFGLFSVQRHVEPSSTLVNNMIYQF